jgi:hypothetical protein
MDFYKKQYDGPYEVSEVTIKNEGETFRGIVYTPQTKFEKPYSLVIYFHRFPQIFTLPEIVKNYKYLLDIGFAFLVFNFRGYRYSEGKVSIGSQISDGIEIFEFIKTMGKKQIFDLDNINLIAEDFGAYIALNVCAEEKLINKLILISPIINVERMVYTDDFKRTLEYIKRFLPGSVKGIEDISKFIQLTKYELKKDTYNPHTLVQKIKVKSLLILIGQKDQITPPSEVEEIFKIANLIPKIIQIPNMDHIPFEERELERLENEIKIFLLQQ